MPARRSPSERRPQVRTPYVDPDDLLGTVATNVAMEGSRWFLGRLLDRIGGRGAPIDPATALLAAPEAPSSGNVRVTRPLAEGQPGSRPV